MSSSAPPSSGGGGSGGDDEEGCGCENNECAECPCPTCFECRDPNIKTCHHALAGGKFCVCDVKNCDLGPNCSLPSKITGLTWKIRYSEEAHEGCDEGDKCEGKTCQYNQLCASCDRVLGIRVGIFCLKRNEKQITVCDVCYNDMKQAMREEGGWTVDGEEIAESDTGEEEDDDEDE